MPAYASVETLRLLLPEIILVGAATAIFLAGAFVRAKEAWSWLAGAALLSAWGWLALAQPEAVAPGPLMADALAEFVRWLMLPLGLLFVLLTARGAAAGQAAEFVGSLLLIVAGAMLTASAGDLVMLFLGLELISIPTYVLLYLGRRDTASREAAAKYFYLSILSSAMMLYGLSFLYGATGTLNLAGMQSALPGMDRSWGGLAGVGLVMVLAGLGFRIAAVPFHFYAPDVYQGTSHANAALLAVVPKVAGITALARVASLFLDMSDLSWGWSIVLWLAVATMTLGNVLALWQDNLRRLLAYSSIAHAGYLLIGLAVAFAENLPGVTTNIAGLQAMLFYLAVYGFATLGAFAALEYLGDGSGQVNDIHELAGLSRTRPLVAIALAVFLFSLAGVPPLAGFFGKLTLFFSAIGVQGDYERMSVSFIILAVIGALNAAIAAAYYLRVVGIMFFGAPGRTPAAAGGRGSSIAAAICLALVIGIGLFPTALMNGAYQAAHSVGYSTAASPSATQDMPRAPVASFADRR
jgi:NADH-quinone oxidoreductase subunit N